MAKAWCLHCDSLEYITPNGVDPLLSNKRQRLALHADKRPGKCRVEECGNDNPCESHGWPLCEGSGTDV
jgi:hypothetical protein